MVPYGMILSLPLTRKVSPLLRALGTKDRWLFAIGCLLVLGTYALLNTGATVPVADRQPQSYYQMLTEAFLSGRTYLRLEPDPRLKALADPWAGAQGIPRAHDATYYDGKYYLYFGTGPVILLMAPWRVLSGTYLREGTATGLFASAGFVLAALFYLRMRRRFFPGTSPWWTFVSVLALGWGSFLPFIVASPRIYDVPISCAFACCMLSAHGLLSAAESTRPRRRAGYAFIASLAWGFAITARPNYIFGAVPLVICDFLIFRRAMRSAARPSAIGFWTAALVPLVAVCAGIALYNFARFNDPREFGTTYQFSAMDMRQNKLFAATNIVQSLGEYLLKEPRRSIYYPFVENSTDVFGLIHWEPFAFVALVLPLTFLMGSVRRPGWALPLGFLLAAAVCNFGSLLPLPFANARYEVDFLPSLTLIGLLMVSIASAALAEAPRWARSGFALGALVVLVPSVFSSLASGLPSASTGPRAKAIARIFNLPAEGLERLEGIKYGPIEFMAEFPIGAKGRREPLVCTGDGQDCVFVEYLGDGRDRIGYVHLGAPGRLSEPLPLGVSPHRVRVDLGGLYPSAEHAAFRAWRDDDVTALRRRVEVSVDGKPALKAWSGFYPSDAWQTSIGSIPIAVDVAPMFTGNISDVRRLGIPSASEVRSGYKTGPARMVARFPKFTAIVGQPLVSTGVHGAGDLIYVLYLGQGKARFGHDSWNYGPFESDPVLFDPSEEQVIEVDMDPLNARPKAGVHPLKVRFNGREIMSTERRFNGSTPEEVAFGYNEIGASTAEILFGGSKFDVTRLNKMPDQVRNFGGVFLEVRLPENRGQISEPLVVTGHQGAADMVYISYVDAGHVRVGFDPWGYGGPQSEPIAVHRGENLAIQVSIGTLHYELDPEWPTLSAEQRDRLLSRVIVHVNGTRVLDAAVRTYASLVDEVFVASNPAGGSTCSDRFTGTIISSERIGAVYQR